MTRTITIDPVTRIEGHAKVLIDLADDNSVRLGKIARKIKKSAEI